MYFAFPSGGIRQKFTGYQKDTETGLDFAEARMYENRHARFTAVDPLLASGKSANPQTFNRYVYVLNSPLVMVDVNGLYPVYFNGITFSTRKLDNTYTRYTGERVRFAAKDGYYWIATKNSLERSNERVKKFVPSKPDTSSDPTRKLIAATDRELGIKIPAVTKTAAVGIPLGVACVFACAPAGAAIAAGVGGAGIAGAEGVAAATTTVMNTPALANGVAFGFGFGTGMLSSMLDPTVGSGGTDIRAGIVQIASRPEYGYGNCVPCARDIANYITANGGSGTILTVATPGAQTNQEIFLYSEAAGTQVSDSGYHQGVLYNGTVYDNSHPEGLPYEQWINNFTYSDPETGRPTTAPVTERRNF